MSGYTEQSITSTDGVKITYLTFGSGKPLIISHGGFTVADEWFATARALAENRQAIVIERRGRGRSGDLQAHSLDKEIDDLAAVIADVGGEVDLLGHSYGGALALGYSLRTGFGGRLVLYEATTAVAAVVGGEKMQPVKQLFEQGQQAEALELLYASVLRMNAEMVEGIRKSPAWDHHYTHLRTFLREVDALDTFAPSIEDCASLKAPVAYFVGVTSDQWVKNSAAAFVQRINGITMLPVRGEGHFAYLSDPQKLAGLIETALELITVE